MNFRRIRYAGYGRAGGMHKGKRKGSERSAKRLQRGVHVLSLCATAEVQLLRNYGAPGRDPLSYISTAASAQMKENCRFTSPRADVHACTKSRVLKPAAPERRGELSCSTREGPQGPRRDSATGAREDGPPLECGTGFSSSFFSSYLSRFGLSSGPNILRCLADRILELRAFDSIFRYPSFDDCRIRSFSSKSIGRDFCIFFF